MFYELGLLKAAGTLDISEDKCVLFFTSNLAFGGLRDTFGPTVVGHTSSEIAW